MKAEYLRLDFPEPVFEVLEPRLLLATGPIITEFMADNRQTLADQNGQFSDWIEIYNPTAEPVDLYHWSLTDSKSDLGQWRFPHVTLDPDQYLVVFASGNDVRIPGAELHTNFKLSAGGEYLALVAPDGTIASQYDEYPEQLPDVSYGLNVARTTTSAVAAGASAKYLVPSSGSLGADWTTTAFSDASWVSGATGLGYDTTPSPGAAAGTMAWGPYGPGGTWNLYEVITSGTTWIAAYNAALTRTQYGVTGHLAVVSSAAENELIRGMLGGQTAWLGLTDSDTFAALGAAEVGNTSGLPLPPDGTAPAAGQRGYGFVWVTGAPFTYQNWAAGQPDDAAPGQDGVSIGSDGKWSDNKSGEGTQTGVNYQYVVEYELNFSGLSVEEAHGAVPVTDLNSAIELLNGGGTSYVSALVNYVDPQNAAGGHFAKDNPFGGNTAADDDHFAVRAAGTVRIPTTGTYTFLVNSAGGFRLTIDGATFTSFTGAGTRIAGNTMLYDGLRAAADSLGVATLAAGDHDFELLYFAGTGAAGVELAAASGSKTAYDTNFRLVGDTLNSGLRVVDVKDLVTTDVRAAMKGVNASLYLRLPFTVADVGKVDKLLLRVKYDAGFVAYVNGEEAMRAYAPETPEWNSAATAEQPDSAAVRYEDFDISDMIDVLVNGTNVLAIQGLNSSAADQDFLILPTLELISQRELTDQARYFVVPTPGATNSMASADLGPIVTNVSQPAAMPADADNIVVTANVRAAFDPIASVTLVYRVNYGGEISLPMYDDGTHGDTAAADGVYAAVIPAGASGPGQMVRWRVTSTDTAGHTGKAPLFTDPLDSPEYFGTVIQDGVTSVYPVFRWFANGGTDTRTGGRACVYYLDEFYDNVFVRLRGGYMTGGRKFNFNSGYHFRFREGVGRANQININDTPNASDATVSKGILGMDTYALLGCPASIVEQWRIQYNGAFKELGIFIEQPADDYLERQGLYGDGALYKMYNAGDSATTGNPYPPRKQSRKDEDNSDLAAFIAGINGANRNIFVYDNLDIPRVIDYIVADVITAESDQLYKNYFLYRDTIDADNPDGTNEWMILPWDRELNFGKGFYGDTTTLSIYFDSSNKITGALLAVPELKAMFLRRLRTAMDAILQTNSTPYADRYYETRIDELYALSLGDPAVLARLGNRLGAFNEVKTYLIGRRNYLATVFDIPSSQVGTPQVNIVDADYNPPSRDPLNTQDQEYVKLTNPNAYAVDISGWTLSGGISFTFVPGTVISAGGSIYVARSVAQFRARHGGPLGGQGLFVVGNYDGALSNWGETITLQDPAGNPVSAYTTPAAPTDAQRYLRVTEVMYNPAPPPAGSPYYNTDFSFVELKNIGTQTLDLSNVRISGGVDFTFPAGRTLDPGEHVLVAANWAAFESRYGTGLPVAGQFRGDLDVTYRLVIDDFQGSTVQDFKFSAKWYDNTDGEGFSLVIRDAAGPRAVWDSKDAWRPSKLNGGSPGYDDVDWNPGSVIVNEMLTHQDTEPPGDWIELRNMTASDIDLGGWYLSDTSSNLGRFRIAAGTILYAGSYLVFTESADFGNPANPGCLVPFALSELGGKAYLSEGVAGGALGGYRESQAFLAADRDVTLGLYTKSTGGTDFVYLAAPTPGAANAYPLVGPVVLNEVMYNPPAGGDEWIELYNLTAADVPLFDPAHPADAWMFTDGVAFTFPAGATIAAHGYALVVGIDPAAFRAKYAVAASVPIFGPYAGLLANEGETLELARPGEPEPPPSSVVPYYRADRVTYNDKAPWPTLADGQGAALNRIDQAAYGNDAANWAPSNPGGTPGAVNRPLDASPPTVPGNLTATGAGDTRLDLAWTPSADPDSGVALYKIYRDGAGIGQSDSASYSDTTVVAGVTYAYEVSAVNIDGYESVRSAAVNGRIVTVASVSAPNSGAVLVVFSETVTALSVQALANYALTDFSAAPVALSSAVLQGDGKTVMLTVAAPLEDGTSYTLAVTNVVSQSGFPIVTGLARSFVYRLWVPGTILREYWTGISGGLVTDLTSNANYPDHPSGSDQLTLFETPSNWADNYGQRVRGYVLPPVTGNYRFWIASDDASELWLSTNENPANKVKIASVQFFTSSREWTREAGQQSALIYLEAGRRYYIEALQKEGGGGDNLAVGWQLPDGTYERPIPGNRLTPWQPDATPPTQVTGVTPTPLSETQVRLTWSAASDPESGVSYYKIYRNNVAVGQATTTTYTDTGLTQDTPYTYRVSAVNPYGMEGALSAPAETRTLRDTIAPVVTVNALLTRDATPALTGTVDDVNAAVAVTVGGKSYAAANNHNGTWTLADNTISPALADGTYDVQARATDGAGNEGADATANELTVDTIAPAVTVDPLVTKDATPALTGTVDDTTAAVSITVGGKTYAATNNHDGTWTLADNTITPALADGTYDVQARATDAAGNVGSDTTTGELVVDATAPTVTVTALRTSDTRPALTGTVNDNAAAISITVAGETYAAANNQNGTWTLADDTISPALAEGTYDVQARATDAVGNVGTDATTGELVIDLTPPTLVSVAATVDPQKVTVVFSEPVDAATATALANYALSGGLAVTAAALNPDNVTVRLTTSTMTAGSVYVLTVNNIRDRAVGANTIAPDTQAVFRFNAATGSGTVDLVPMTATWAYNQSGADLGTAWKDVGYNDASWPTGGALLYNESATLPAPKTTLLTLGPITYYFRMHFTLADDPRNVTALRATTIVDDGMVVYLNGYELLRVGMNAGTPNYQTLANRSLYDATVEGPFAVSTDHLVQGDNVLTVEVHQVTSYSSDVVFGLSLQVTVQSDIIPPGAAITPIAPDPRTAPVDQISIVFDKPVTGFDLADLRLSLGGGPNLLSAAQTLTSADNVTWTLGNLAGLTAADGTYTLTLKAAGSGITDASSNPLGLDAAESWLMDATAPVVTVTPRTTSDQTPDLSGTINDPYATIAVTVGGHTYAAANNADGTWTLADNAITPALADGTYDVQAAATDLVGNVGHDSTANELVIDTTAPTTPTNLQAVPFSDTQIDLAWTASTDPESGVLNYKVYRNGTCVATPAANSYSDTSLAPNTTYAYTVSAVNGTEMEGSQSSPSVSAKTLTAYPQVLASVINGGLTQRSVLQTVAVQFSKDVSASLDVNDLALYNQTTGGPAADLTGASVVYNSGTQTATWTLSAVTLADGWYTAKVLGSGVSDAAGHLLDGNGDGAGGDNYVFQFSLLKGDATGDAKVNIFDLLKIRQNYLKAADDPTRDSNADVTGDGNVNIFDLLMVRQNYLKELVPVGGPLSAVVEPLLALETTTTNPDTDAVTETSPAPKAESLVPAKTTLLQEVAASGLAPVQATASAAGFAITNTTSPLDADAGSAAVETTGEHGKTRRKASSVTVARPAKPPARPLRPANVVRSPV